MTTIPPEARTLFETLCDGEVPSPGYRAGSGGSWPPPDTTWSTAAPLRNHFERRQAPVELDVLSALELGLTIEELCTTYRTQFPVLREYENSTWYDQNGRSAFTTNRGLPGVGLVREKFEAWQRALNDGSVVANAPDYLKPPFELRDREEDMRAAYSAMEGAR